MFIMIFKSNFWIFTLFREMNEMLVKKESELADNLKNLEN